MNIKKFIGAIFLIVIVAIVINDLFGKGYTIENVVDGNTIVLNTGATVKLIGVSNTEQARDALQELKDESWRFDLLADSHAQFNEELVTENMTVYAYVLLRDKSKYECINATLLKEGLTDFLEIENLSDSTKKFKEYARIGSGKHSLTPVTPTPIVYSEDDIELPAPPQLSNADMLRRKQNQHFTSDDYHNLCMLDTACDYDCAYTRKFATSLAARSEGYFNVGQICEIFNYCYNKWRYVNDPKGEEYVASASESIYNSLIGDCDDFAVLMASCMLAVGGNICINIAENDKSGHAFTEVDIAPLGDVEDVMAVIKNKFPQYADRINKLNIRQDGEYKWMNLDWNSEYPGGDYYNFTLISRYTCINSEWSTN